jgi:hypothetical protein
MVWTGSIWLKIGTSGGLLWTRQWTFGFHKMLGSSWVAVQFAASQEGLSSVSKYLRLSFTAAAEMLPPWRCHRVKPHLQLINITLHDFQKTTQYTHSDFGSFSSTLVTDLSKLLRITLMLGEILKRVAIKTNSVAVVRKRTIPIEPPPPTFAGRGCCVVSATNSHGP